MANFSGTSLDHLVIFAKIWGGRFSTNQLNKYDQYLILTEPKRWIMFASEDETTREFIREQLESDDGTSLSHQLSRRYSFIVEHTVDCGMVVKATRMDRVSFFPDRCVNKTKENPVELLWKTKTLIVSHQWGWLVAKFLHGHPLNSRHKPFPIYFVIKLLHNLFHFHLYFL